MEVKIWTVGSDITKKYYECEEDYWLEWSEDQWLDKSF